MALTILKAQTFVLNSYKNQHMVEQILDQIHIAFRKGFGIFSARRPLAVITTLRNLNVLMC